MESTPKYQPFRRVGTGVIIANINASSSSANALNATGTAVSGITFLGSAFSNWTIRVKLVGAGTSGQITLLGMVGTTSDVAASLRPLTSWDGSVNTSDDMVFVTGKAATAVAACWSTASSSATSANIWIAGTV